MDRLYLGDTVARCAQEVQCYGSTPPDEEDWIRQESGVVEQYLARKRAA
ncbi:MAG: hypothetical protein ACE14M_12930 [Terriglobales bacterium]